MADDAPKSHPGSEPPDERMLRVQLANMRQRISAPAVALIGYGRDVQEQARALGFDSFIADIEQLIAAAHGFETKIGQILDPNRAKDLHAIADLNKAKSVLRHDLSNPIAAVLGYAEMLLEDAEEAEEADQERLQKTSQDISVEHSHQCRGFSRSASR